MQPLDISSISQEALFDQLAPDYALLLQNWESYLTEQGKLLDRLFKAYAGQPVRTVLDCTCGIGTQCLALASLGYRVTGTDISNQAITRAQREAERLSLNVSWQRADVRRLDEVVAGTFDAVISCDNSLPALLSEAELIQAVRQIFERLESPGISIISMRDYQQIFAEKKRFNLRQIHQIDGNRLIVFDLWDYQEEFVTFTVLFVREGSAGWSVTCHPMVYRAIYSNDFIRILREVGFNQVELIKQLDGQSLQFDYYICSK